MRVEVIRFKASQVRIEGDVTIRRNSDGRIMLVCMISVPGLRDYPHAIRKTDRVYFTVRGYAPTVREAVDLLLRLIKNKVRPDAQEEYRARVIRAIGEAGTETDILAHLNLDR